MVLANTPMSDLKASAEHGERSAARCAALRGDLVAEGQTLLSWQAAYDRAAAGLGGEPVPADIARPPDPPTVAATDYAG
jgi:hypothetical protein